MKEKSQNMSFLLKAIKTLSIIWQLYDCFYYREEKAVHCLNFSLGILEVVIT